MKEYRIVHFGHRTTWAKVFMTEPSSSSEGSRYREWIVVIPGGVIFVKKWKV